MPYALSGQSLADALSQSQKLAKRFVFGFPGAFVVGRAAAGAKLASPAATMAIPSLFIGSPAMGSIAPAGVNPPSSPNAASKLTSTKSTIAPTRTWNGTVRKLPAPQIVNEPLVMYADIYRKASRPAKAQSARRFVSSRQVRLGHAPSAMGGDFGYGSDVSMSEDAPACVQQS